MGFHPMSSFSKVLLWNTQTNLLFVSIDFSFRISLINCIERQQITAMKKNSLEMTETNDKMRQVDGNLKRSY